MHIEVGTHMFIIFHMDVGTQVFLQLRLGGGAQMFRLFHLVGDTQMFLLLHLGRWHTDVRSHVGGGTQMFLLSHMDTGNRCPTYFIWEESHRCFHSLLITDSEQMIHLLDEEAGIQIFHLFQTSRVIDLSTLRVKQGTDAPPRTTELSDNKKHINSLYA